MPTAAVVVGADGLPFLQTLNLAIGNQAGQISLSAHGGADSGSGGSAFISAGGNLTVDATAMNLGDAPSISLSAGSNGQGNLLVTGNLVADGVNGAGGSIYLSSNSADAFVIGRATVNGVTGILSAKGSLTNAGSGGSISISNEGTGGITLPNLANVRSRHLPMAATAALYHFMRQTVRSPLPRAPFPSMLPATRQAAAAAAVSSFIRLLTQAMLPVTI